MVPFTDFPRCIPRVLAAMASWLTALACVGSAAANDPPRFDRDVTTFLAKHCIACHGGKKPKADLSLDTVKTEADVLKTRKQWSVILRQVSDGEMPPPERPRPTAKEAAAFEAAVRDVFRRADAGKPRDPGRVTIRRLNKTEYNNTIRDLCMIEFEPADDFPADDAGYGFDNIADVLSLSPTLMEHYLNAAEAVVTRTIVTGKRPPPKVRSGTLQFISATNGTQDPGGVSVFTSEPIVLTFRVAADGEYAVRFAGEAINASDSPVQIALVVDGKELKRFTAGKTDPKIKGIDVPVTLKKGSHDVRLMLLNPSPELEANKKAYPPVIGLKVEKMLRGCLVTRIDLVGPLDELPEGYRRIMVCDAKGEPREQAREILGRFASRAFRRPATLVEVERYLKLYEKRRAAGDSFDAAIQIGLQAILVSSNFLFRVELDNRPQTAGPQPISEYQLASRLSYFLWSSMPDDELLGLAAKGELTKNLDIQVRRMLADWKSEAFVENFTAQWLGIRGIEALSRTKEFPFDLRLRYDMSRETLLFSQAVFRENRPITDFINGNFTFLNARLAKLYKIADVDGQPIGTAKDKLGDPIPIHQFVRVSLPPGGVRGGVLTQASVLTVTSNPDRTSPVRRGVWIMERILGTSAPPPPPDVPELETKQKSKTPVSFRERMELHRAKTECAACHAKMDPLGFAFEKFDAIGQYREFESKGAKGKPIDVSGVLPDGQKFNGANELRKILFDKKDQFARCLTDKMLTYALGRGIEDHDEPTIDAIVAALAKDDYRINTLIIEIVKSDPFRMRRGKQGVKK